jgi:hypothetical protein
MIHSGAGPQKGRDPPRLADAIVEKAWQEHPVLHGMAALDATGQSAQDGTAAAVAGCRCETSIVTKVSLNVGRDAARSLRKDHSQTNA